MNLLTESNLIPMMNVSLNFSLVEFTFPEYSLEPNKWYVITLISLDNTLYDGSHKILYGYSNDIHTGILAIYNDSHWWFTSQVDSIFYLYGKEYTVTLYVKRKVTDSNANAVITLKGKYIDKNTIEFYFLPSTTENATTLINEKVYPYDVQVTTKEGKVYSALRGSFVILQP